MKWSEIRPIAFFLGKFVAFYFVGNLLYGWWVTTFEPHPDPMTVAITNQSTNILSALGYDVTHASHPEKPTERIFFEGKNIVAVYEGCNGINVWIIFTGFLIAFSKPDKRLLIFLAIGSVIVYLTNVARIVLLFLVAISYPHSLYFIHKYLFTAIIYAVVFVLWYGWISYGRKSEIAR